MAPQITTPENFQCSLQILQVQCKLIESISTLPLITNYITQFTVSFNKFLLELIQTKNKTGQQPQTLLNIPSNGQQASLFQTGLEICTPIALFTTMSIINTNGEMKDDLPLLVQERRIKKLEFLLSQA